MSDAREITTLPPTEADTEGFAAEPAEELEPGTRLGRYLVLRRIGAGGMAVVYTAVDPELDRKVALKLVRDSGDGEVRRRLVREAQAMAQLAHPNVVPVYDVGVVGERLFIAMELVVGKNGREWLESRPSGSREVLAVYEQAGRGLAAAHAAGFVHRDFKPENILVGDDGRVRVTDFGLVRVHDDGPATARGEDAPRAHVRAPGKDTSTSTLTRADTLMGTPFYMAPEQFLGETAGPAADQFAFAVALHEALYGERPFGKGPVDTMRRAVLAGEPRPPASERGVPRRVRRALVRALARDPAARWPTMDALLAALRPEPWSLWQRAPPPRSSWR